MSEQLPERADIRQLRTQAKELLRSLKNGDTLDQGKKVLNPKLADAQLLIARKYGFDSWPKLVDKVETPALIEKFKNAIESGNSVALEDLLQKKPILRKNINEPFFAFGSQAVVRASMHPKAEKLLPILVHHGADPNVRTNWWAGGFSALDLIPKEKAELLVDLGACYDVWSASAHGKIDILRELLDKDPESVNARGGDGGTPMHFAATADVAELLIQRGADLEIQDVDHEGTAIQHHVNNTDILRVLLRHGAKPDIFTAVVLNDVDLVRNLLLQDSSVTNAHVGAAPFVTQKSNGGHIYLYKLGSAKTPIQIAAERGTQDVFEELKRGISPARSLIASAWIEDERAVKEILSLNPDIEAEMSSMSNAITEAAQAGKAETVRLLLLAGLDPLTKGMDSGTALHLACWYGHAEVVKLLVEKVPLDLKDSVHGSPPLGWAAHGANNCNNKVGDYAGVVTTLLEAGANIHDVANSAGVSMLAQAGWREDIKDIFRKYGAK